MDSIVTNSVESVTCIPDADILLYAELFEFYMYEFLFVNKNFVVDKICRVCTVSTQSYCTVLCNTVQYSVIEYSTL